MKLSLIFIIVVIVLISCNDQKENVAPTTTAQTPVPAAAPSAPEMPELPGYVVYKNWEIGNPAYVKMIADAYASWDSDNPQDLANFFADSAIFDLPDGKRVIAKPTVEQQLKKWRNVYAKTTNIPFSLLSIHNKDLNQDWVIAWTWNKWQYKDGVKDSMLYADNWKIVDGKIAQMVSLQQRPNKQLSKVINERISQ